MRRYSLEFISSSTLLSVGDHQRRGEQRGKVVRGSEEDSEPGRSPRDSEL